MNNLHRHSLAKTLRKNFTDTERFLWRHLRAKQINGYKFRRQEPIGPYIVDFICQEARVIIEVDGGQHSMAREKDFDRDKWLKEQDYRVLRFRNNEVLTNINGVLEIIGIMLNTLPLPLPSREGNKRYE